MTLPLVTDYPFDEMNLLWDPTTEPSSILKKMDDERRRERERKYTYSCFVVKFLRE